MWSLPMMKCNFFCIGRCAEAGLSEHRIVGANKLGDHCDAKNSASRSPVQIWDQRCQAVASEITPFLFSLRVLKVADVSPVP